MNKNMRRCFAAAAGLLIAAALPLTAQAKDTVVAARYRKDCRVAYQVLSAGHPHAGREWALSYISVCGTAGPDVLALQWRTFPEGGAELEQLVRSSARLRDARLYRQLRQTAQDRSAPPEARVGAMLVLSRYTDPNNAI